MLCHNVRILCTILIRSLFFMEVKYNKHEIFTYRVTNRHYNIAFHAQMDSPGTTTKGGFCFCNSFFPFFIFSPFAILLQSLMDWNTIFASTHSPSQFHLVVKILDIFQTLYFVIPPSLLIKNYDVRKIRSTPARSDIFKPSMHSLCNLKFNLWEEINWKDKEFFWITKNSHYNFL